MTLLNILSSRMRNHKQTLGDVPHDTSLDEDTTMATTATTTSDTPRGDDPRVERTRAAVIDAARELLMTDGPGAITHASVATAAGVSRTTVYSHWPTRSDLLRATIDSIRHDKPQVGDLTGSLRHDLGVLFGPLVRDLSDEQRAPMIANMMERALHDPEVIAVRDEFLAEFARLFGQIVDTAVAAGSFSTLAAALQAGDLVGTLKSDGPFTVFAPTDAAFAELPDGTIETLLMPENKDKLVAILTYHVVPGNVSSAEVVGLTSAKTVNGESVAIRVDGGTVFINDARVEGADVEASNGVIHVIDKVLLPN